MKIKDVVNLTVELSIRCNLFCVGCNRNYGKFHDIFWNKCNQ